jgi:hypothetical protein
MIADYLYPVTGNPSRGTVLFGAVLLAVILTAWCAYWSWAMRVYARGRPRYGTPAYDREFSRVRLQVLRRDGYRCRGCGAGGSLDVHHIVARAHGGSNDPSNLVSLCPGCHGLAHGHR